MNNTAKECNIYKKKQKNYFQNYKILLNKILLMKNPKKKNKKKKMNTNNNSNKKNLNYPSDNLSKKLSL